METYEELLAIADKLDERARTILPAKDRLDRLEDACKELGRSFSGSWWGYHSRVYYNDLKPAPPGAHFSPVTGFGDGFGTETVGDWKEYDAKDIGEALDHRAGIVDLKALTDAAKYAADYFENAKGDIVSMLSIEVAGDDSYVAELREKLTALKEVSVYKIAMSWRPTGQLVTEELSNATKGQQIPPHLGKLAVVAYIKGCFSLCAKASDIARRAGSHLERKERKTIRSARIGTNVFIGHGRSAAWRDIKDFVKDRLHLPYDEFNRVPIAGVTNIARLSEMLDSAAFAFVVMTAEDEMADGETQARMNVIHEVGLFQGRLGFRKAIVLLEDGCAEFSNIQGLGQIRFPKGNVSAVFEQLREVLEREGVLAR